LNQTQSRQSGDLAAQKPDDSVDIRNEPWLLGVSPWKCRGGECSKVRNYRKREAKKRQSGGGQTNQFTVETQAQGLNVVRVAADFALRGDD
jgi:hypothetical protein